MSKGNTGVVSLGSVTVTGAARGLEISIGERLAELRRLNEEATGRG